LVAIRRQIAPAAAAAERKLRVGAHRVIADEIELAPKRIEFLLFLFIENHFNERLIVAGITEQTVQPRAEVTLPVHRSDWIETASFAQTERRRKHLAEAGERGFVTIALPRWDNQIRVFLPRFCIGGD